MKKAIRGELAVQRFGVEQPSQRIRVSDRLPTLLRRFDDPAVSAPDASRRSTLGDHSAQSNSRTQTPAGGEAAHPRSSAMKALRDSPRTTLREPPYPKAGMLVGLHHDRYDVVGTHIAARSRRGLHIEIEVAEDQRWALDQIRLPGTVFANEDGVR
jgi:hypothetical protein